MEDWEFFFRIEGHGASLLFVDLSLAHHAEPRRPWLISVAYPLKTPRSDGLSDESEAHALEAIEDELFGAITSTCRGRYLARTTHAGVRTHYYYVPVPDALPGIVRGALARFPEYEAVTESRHDPHWAFFQDHLAPRGLERQSITTRRLASQYLEAGHDVTRSRTLVHTCLFPSEETRDILLAQVSGHGFETTVGELGESGDSDLPYALELRRDGTLEWELLDGAVTDLYLRTESAGGRYDGWRIAE